MAGPLDSLTGMIPSGASIASGGMSLFKVLTIFLIFVVFVVLLGIGLWVWIRSLKYKHKIIIFEKINGQLKQMSKDKATEVKYGNIGDYVFHLKKKGKYLPPPTIQTGNRVWWYYIREDGEWINFGIEDIDVAMRRAKAKFLHNEARAFRTSFQTNLKNRLEERKFMDKYGPLVVSIVLFAVVGLIMWFMADKLVTFLDKLSPVLDAAKEVSKSNAEVLQALDRVCGGSGMVPAGV